MKTIKIKDKDFNIKFTNRKLSAFCDKHGSLEMISLKAIKGNKIKLTVDLLWAGMENFNSGYGYDDVWDLIDEVSDVDKLYNELYEELTEVGFIRASSSDNEENKKELKNITPEEMELMKSLLL